MKTKNLTRAAIMLAIGTILHYIVPGFLGGMKPDFLLLMMFMAILMSPDLKSSLAISVLSGLIAAITTSFPGGQLPNLIDKVLAGLFVYFVANRIREKKGSLTTSSVGIISGIGTFLSGSIFLTIALAIMGLGEKTALLSMLAAIVLPTSLLTALLSVAIYKIIKRANFALN